jgi:hypothetical protein
MSRTSHGVKTRKASTHAFSSLAGQYMDIGKTVSALCTPSQVYLGLSVISVLSMFLATYSLFDAVVGLAVASIWAAILNAICKSGYTTISWVILALPVIMSMGGGVALAAKANATIA